MIKGAFDNAWVFATLAILSLSACSGTDVVSVSIRGDTSQSLTVPAATEFSVTLQTIGGGQYISPPQISSSSVDFIDMQFVGAVPAGPTQRFRFLATTHGKAIIVFQHTASGRTVEDTVSVL
jgi:hypothetical protein